MRTGFDLADPIRREVCPHQWPSACFGYELGALDAPRLIPAGSTASHEILTHIPTTSRREQ